MKRILLAAALAACSGSAATTATSTTSATQSPAAAKAADFTLTDSDGNPVALHDLLKNGPVILAFFPKAFTGGCTSEMTAYRERYEKVQAKGAQIVAVSTDDVATLKKFKESLGAPFPFLSDPEGKVAAQYGGAADGHAKRATFVIAPDGTVGHTDSGTAALIPDPAIDACPQGGKKI